MSSSTDVAPELGDETLYHRVGGEPTFVALVEAFYDGVEQDPPLRAIYPEDLEPGKWAFAMFLSQRFGGPPIYSAKKGHPRLRMRHGPFRVTPDGAERWVRHFVAAVDAVGITGADADELKAYGVGFAPQMVNTFEGPGTPPGGLPQA